MTVEAPKGQLDDHNAGGTYKIITTRGPEGDVGVRKLLPNRQPTEPEGTIHLERPGASEMLLVRRKGTRWDVSGPTVPNTKY